MSENSEQFEDIDELTEAIETISKYTEKKKFTLLRSEAILLASIKREPGHPVKFYLSKSGLSSRWFHRIISELIGNGLVQESKSVVDCRQKILR